MCPLVYIHLKLRIIVFCDLTIFLESAIFLAKAL